MSGAVPKLSKIERNKDPKARKARDIIRKCKITGAIDIPSIKEELKQKYKQKHRGKDDLIKVTSSTGKIRSSRRMPKNYIEK